MAEELPIGDPTTTPALNSEKRAAFRRAQFGMIYDKLEPHQDIDISAFGGIHLEIDEENLGLEKVSIENLREAWEGQHQSWEAQCRELGIKVDPFTVFKYFHIQRKAFRILGESIRNEGERANEFRKKNMRSKLSETKGLAMCSEYAILCTYIAQKLGDDVNLIIGSAIIDDAEEKWRYAHAFCYDKSNDFIFDPVLAESDSEWPAIMVPTNEGILYDMESGYDIRATRIGTNFERIYGLEAGGFGAKFNDSNGGGV